MENSAIKEIIISDCIIYNIAWNNHAANYLICISIYEKKGEAKMQLWNVEKGIEAPELAAFTDIPYNCLQYHYSVDTSPSGEFVSFCNKYAGHIYI